MTNNTLLCLATATYDFLAIEAASDDKVMDVLFIIRAPESSQNHTCVGAGTKSLTLLSLNHEEFDLISLIQNHPVYACVLGLPSPCLFMLAVDGSDGRTLWERPLHLDFHWAQCGLERAGRNWDCLVSHFTQLTAIDKHTGL